MLSIITLSLVAAHARQVEKVPAGELYAFGQLSADKPTVPLGSPSIAPFLQNSSVLFRSVGAGPNSIAVITDTGIAEKIDDISNTGTLSTPLTECSEPGEDVTRGSFCQTCRGVINTFALTCDGRAFSWGGRARLVPNDPDSAVSFGIQPIPLEIPEKVIQISCASNHTLLLTESRRVYVVGETSEGRVGLPEIKDPRVTTPTVLEGLTKEAIGDDDEVCFVSAGGRSSFAITNKGKLFAWGANNVGQLGLNSSEPIIAQPTLVKNDPEFEACEVAVNDDFAIGYDDKGDLWTWGAGNVSPVRFGAAPDMQAFFSLLTSRAVMVAAGHYHMALLQDDGKVYSLGYNRFSQLGVELSFEVPLEKESDFEPDSPIWTLKPQLIELLSDKNITAIYAAGNYTLAVTGVHAPHNCPCARGSRGPTEFVLPVAPIIPPSPPPKPQQPETETSNLFAPVSPYISTHSRASREVLPGEVEDVSPLTMEEFRPTQMWDGVPKTVLSPPKPDLAPSVAKYYIYPHVSDEYKAFNGDGIKKGVVNSLFGKAITPEGYFYGDQDSEVADPTYTRETTMPSAREGVRMPEGDVTSAMVTRRVRREDAIHGVFSLSLQDVRAPRDIGDVAMRRSTFSSVSDLEDSYQPVDFDRADALTGETERVSAAKAVPAQQPLVD